MRYVLNTVTLLSDFCTGKFYRDTQYNDAVANCVGNLTTLTTYEDAAFQFKEDVTQTAGLISPASVKAKTKLIFSDPATKLGWFDKANERLQERLEDKLAVLPSHSAYTMVMVAREVRYRMSKTQSNEFAKRVFLEGQKAGLGNDVILVTLPYYTDYCELNGKAGTKAVGMAMAGVYTTDSQLLAGLQAALQPGTEADRVTDAGKLYDYLVDAYRLIPKDHYVYGYSFTWNGDFLKYQMVNHHSQKVSGFENIYDLLIEDDGRFEKLQTAGSQMRVVLNELESVNFDGSQEDKEKILNVSLESYNSSCQAILAGADFLKVLEVQNIKQKTLQDAGLPGIEDFTYQYAKWKWSKKTKIDFFKWSPEGKWFYGGINQEAALDNLKIIDTASFFLGFVGLDWVLETYGSYYALQNGLTNEAFIRASAATIIGLTPGSINALRAITEGGSKLAVKASSVGVKLVVRQIYTKQVVLAPCRRFYSMFLPVGTWQVTDVLSSSLVNSLSNNFSLLKTIWYARQSSTKKLVPLFEQAIAENAAFKELVNSEPQTVNEFFAYCRSTPTATLEEVVRKVSRVRIGTGKQVDKLFSTIKDEPDFQGFRSLCKNNPNISIELADENWSTFVTNTKSIYGIGNKRNLAKMEYNGIEYLIASSAGYNGQMANSGKFLPEAFIIDIENGIRVFEPTMHTRRLDTESFGLEYFAKQKGAEKGKKYLHVTDELKLSSDLCPCPSCSAIFQQFSDMFPNVKIKIITTIKLHY